MSGSDTTQDEPKPASSEAEASKADGGVIPVEVEAPDAPAAKADAANGTTEAKADAKDAKDEAKPEAKTEAKSDDKPAVEEKPAPDPLAEANAKIAQLEKEKKDHWDKLLRATADLDNFRKRQKRELEDVKFETKNKVLKEMLPVVDNLERAIEHASKGEEKNPIVEGVQLVLRQFTTAFERLEVTPIDAMGQPFDPNLHEAISQQDSDLAPGTIVQVLQRGYKAGERLLRPSLVVVAKAKAGAE